MLLNVMFFNAGLQKDCSELNYAVNTSWEYETVSNSSVSLQGSYSLFNNNFHTILANN